MIETPTTMLKKILQGNIKLNSLGPNLTMTKSYNMENKN